MYFVCMFYYSFRVRDYRYSDVSHVYTYDDDDDDDDDGTVRSSPHDVRVRATSSTARVTWLPAHHHQRHYHYLLW